MTWIIRNAAFMCIVVAGVTVCDIVLYPGDVKLLLLSWTISYLIWSLECSCYFLLGILKENFSLNI